MVEDIIRKKGPLTLGSRLRRIGERLQAETQQVMDGHGVPVQANQYPLLAALDENGPMAIGELAAALGVSQPGVTRSVGQLARQGLVEVRRSEADQRARLAHLTDAGRAVVRHGREVVWPEIEACVAALLGDRTGPLLDQLDRLEAALGEASFAQRIARTRQADEATGHILDRPVWSALATRHARFAIGRDRARRFRTDISPFAAAPDESAASLAALGALVASDGPVIVAQAPAIAAPPGMLATPLPPVAQMVFEGTAPPARNGLALRRLGEADATAMLDLARLTEPGPFESRTCLLGDYLGIEEDGRLVAMAGERLKQPGFTEVSAVCTHPDHRGHGHARELCSAVLEGILARGERAYLHVFVSNTAAIALYRSLGFRERTRINVAQLTAA